MLVVIAHEIGQRETIVAGDEVDAGVRLPPTMLIQIAASRQS